MSEAARSREALRQQMLLRALWSDPGADAVDGWLRVPAPRAARGLQAYRANSGALAERALAAAFPTIAQLVGDVPFGALARAFWQAEPPSRGDVAQWAATLPAFIAAAAQLAGEPYLADVARIDWKVHVAEQASDASATVAGLDRLASIDPAELRLHLAAGTALVCSPHPVATIWRAHRSSAANRFEAVREAFARGGGEQALIRRDGWKASVTPLPEADARFVQAVLEGRSLGHALDQAGPGFAFEPWLLAALKQGWLVAVDSAPVRAAA